MPPKKRQAASKPSYGACKRRLRSQKALPPPHPGLPDEEAKKYTFASPYPQRFSFPENIVYFIARNPKNIHYHQNLMKSCKLLFRMSLIVSVEKIRNEYYKNGQMKISVQNGKKRALVNLGNELFYKLWIHRDLALYEYSTNFASSLVKYIAKCTLKELTLHKQILTFAELQILVAGDKLEKIKFENNVIKNGKDVCAFEDVFEAIYCKEMKIILPDNQHGVGKSTASKIAEYMESNGREYSVEIDNIPEIFNMQSFFGFLKANMNNRHHNISLAFADTISSVYKNQLEEFVKEIIQIRNVYAHLIPYICYRGQNTEYWNELHKMRNEYFKGLIKKGGYSYSSGSSCRRSTTKVSKDMMM